MKLKILFILSIITNALFSQVNTCFDYAMYLGNKNYQDNASHYSHLIKQDSFPLNLVVENKYVWKKRTYDNLVNIEYLCLDVDMKKERGIPVKLNQLNSLKYLVINGTSPINNLKFDGEDGLDSLKFFIVSNTVLDSIPTFIYNSLNLECISIIVNNDNPINYQKLKQLKKLKIIEVINANDTNVNIWSDEVYSIENLEQISFSGNTYIKLDKRIMGMKNLKVLLLNNYNESEYESLLNNMGVQTERLIFNH